MPFSHLYDQVTQPVLIKKLCLLCLWIFCFVIPATCMTEHELGLYRNHTVDLFYHGFTNYLDHAFPEDELRPVSCTPLTRDRANPAHIEVNDVLGNYSLTLIDSLSTLAILASSTQTTGGGRRPLVDFQDGVAALVQLYGDGSNSSASQGTRSRGFDLDSKVQVFETVIRGVGGLLSAHLFAVGELPIRGYDPSIANDQHHRDATTGHVSTIRWSNGFSYNGQLLRLANDLATRLLPAFYTNTGLPYPRVNLRHGVPFYANSPLNADPEMGVCFEGEVNGPSEITETCSAGAGSLVLEFTTLSRLIGNPVFEQVAKEAFLAVWDRRSVLNLIGSGIDAETGNWVSTVTGNGAGVDSYFEYAVKSHILLSGSPNNDTGSPDFLGIWNEAHAGIKHHLYRGSDWQHPHYVQGDLYTGATRAYWMDSLSAFYPGLLVLDGKLDEAIETHLLWVALWTRYAATPERWSVATGNIENGLRWWGGRPEFTESTWYLYQATKDPWYLHVAEMIVRDIQRRCWTECGWAGLEDVRTGELKDRMESFFLGETAKYLYLTFDPAHPLNTLDSQYVFTTEGHPLILPKPRIPKYQKKSSTKRSRTMKVSAETQSPRSAAHTEPMCASPSPMLPFSISHIASRSDLFHAGALARLPSVFWQDRSSEENIESSYDTPNLASAFEDSPSNFTFYPWTLPTAYIPSNGTSDTIRTRNTFDLSFPTVAHAPAGVLSLQRVDDGMIVRSTSGLKMSMVRETELVEADGQLSREERFRVYSVGPINLGRYEKLSIASEAISHVDAADPFFTRHREIAFLDLVLENGSPTRSLHSESTASESIQNIRFDNQKDNNINLEASALAQNETFLRSLLSQFSALLNQPLAVDDLLSSIQIKELPTSQTPTTSHPGYTVLAASVAAGTGSGTIPDVSDAPSLSALLSAETPIPQPWSTIYVLDGDNCTPDTMSSEIPRDFEVLVMKRGNCSFLEKLRNIPAFAPVIGSLQLVVIVSDPAVDGEDLIRPLVDAKQETPKGILRRVPIPLVMVGGGSNTMEAFKRAKSMGLRRRYWFSSQGVRIGNVVLL